MPLFVFRRYKKEEGGESTKAKHPKLIVDEQNQDYGFMGLTKSPKRGNHNNIKIDNPQKNNTEDSYIRKELRYDNKKYFGEILTDYVLSEKDIEKILEFLEDKKKKQPIGGSFKQCSHTTGLLPKKHTKTNQRSCQATKQQKIQHKSRNNKNNRPANQKKGSRK